MIVNLNVAAGASPADLKSGGPSAGTASTPSSPGRSESLYVDTMIGSSQEFPTAGVDGVEDVANGDSAKQLTNYACASILEQPAIAMGAQANQTSQIVMRLLG